LLILLMSCGCILTPEIESEPDEILYAPEIVVPVVPNDTAAILELDIACTPVDFYFEVRDENIRDTIYVRWLEDWSADDREDNWPVFLIRPDGYVQRRSGGQTTLDISLYEVDSVHTLRVFVADRPPKTDDTNGMELPAGSEGQSDYHQWTFRIMPEGSGFCPPGI